MQALRCTLHPTEPLVNFCTRQQCLSELCASCIGHHTDVHALAGTLPHYENIQQTFRKAYDAVDTHRSVIESEKKKIIQFSQSWEKNKDSIYSTIRKAKKEVLELVDRTFLDLENLYSQKIHEEEIKIGMKNADTIMKMLDAHTSESDKLFALQRDLKTVRGPQAIKALYAEVLPKNTELLNRISSDFTILGTFDMKLEYFQNNLINLKQNIHDLFGLQVSYPEKIFFKDPMRETVRQPFNSSFNDSINFSDKALTRSRSSYLPRPVSVVSRPLESTFYGSRISFEPKISVGDSMGNSFRSSNGFLRASRRTNVFPSSPIIIR